MAASAARRAMRQCAPQQLSVLEAIAEGVLYPGRSVDLGLAGRHPGTGLNLATPASILATRSSRTPSAARSMALAIALREEEP